MAKDKKEPKRRNRTVGLADAMQGVIDPVFRKRGFANRDIITNWAAIAPTPYDKVSVPEKLLWPRGTAGADGAILFLRCAEAHRLALAHEGATIAAAVNRYFGYILVGQVKLSPAPFISGSGQKKHIEHTPAPETVDSVNKAVSEVSDDGIKHALQKLGLGIMQNKN